MKNEGIESNPMDRAESKFYITQQKMCELE